MAGGSEVILTTMHCPVCQARNDDFATTCTACGGFLQNRVPNLDLFDTVWTMLESPGKAFRRIGLAEHKNYAVALFMAFGIGCAFGLIWIFRAGEMFESLFQLIIWSLLAGAVLGIVMHPVVAGIYWLATRALGGRRRYRQALGVVAYALSPSILTVIFVLPVELLTFGIYLFTGNPHPYTIKPVSYLILIGLDAIGVLWSVALLAYGTHLVHAVSPMRAAASAVVTACLVGGLLYWIGSVAATRLALHGVLIGG